MSARRFVRADVLGVGVAASSLDEARALLERAVANRDPATFLCANAYSLVLAGDDPAQRARMNRASYVMADGMPVVWFLRALGLAAERVHGDDLLLACCAEHPGWRHFLLGGAPGQPERVARELRRRFPGIRIAGMAATPRRPVPEDEAEKILTEVRASGAEIVWVGMGTPAQDAWMDAWAESAGVPMAGCGSAFDVLAGRTREPPDWIKRSGLQWLFRLLQEPRRLGRRYLVTNPRFAFRALGALFGGARRRSPAAARVSLRAAQAGDSERIWAWRNEPAARRSSFHDAPIPRCHHEAWFAERLGPGSPTTIFIALDASRQEVGYVRFEDRGAGRIEISVVVAPAHRGRGVGPAAIRAGTDRVLERPGVRRVVARVRADNPASRTAFERAGYVLWGHGDVAGIEALELVREADPPSPQSGSLGR